MCILNVFSSVNKRKNITGIDWVDVMDDTSDIRSL
jgi:hypothetical protein